MGIKTSNVERGFHFDTHMCSHPLGEATSMNYNYEFVKMTLLPNYLEVTSIQSYKKTAANIS